MPDIATTDTFAPPPSSADTPEVLSKYVSDPIDTGKGDEANLRAATEELRKRRERDWESGAISDDAFAEQHPVLERRYDGREHGAKSLGEATRDLSDAHFDERFETQWAAARTGLDPAQLRELAKDPNWVRQQRPDWNEAEISEYVKSGAMPPDKIGLVADYWGKDGAGKVLREPLKDSDTILGRPEHEALTPRDAAREVKAFREAAAAQQQALLEQLTQQEQAAQAEQQAAAEQQQPAQQPQQPQQQQPDPTAAERQQLAAAAQYYAIAARATEGERHAAAQIKAWTENFNHTYPEANSPAAMAELQRTNVQRFAALQRDAQRCAQNIDAYVKQGMAATQAREQSESQLAAHQHAATRAAWHEFRERNDRLAHQRIPELADTQKAAALRDGTKAMLREHGFDERELSSAWDGQSGFSLRDGRVQAVLADAARWRMAMANKNSIASKRLQPPPVQRPGTARPRGADNEADIARLQRELANASGAAAVRIATKLHQLQRQAG